jgi:hypothetical protein
VFLAETVKLAVWVYDTITHACAAGFASQKTWFG